VQIHLRDLTRALQNHGHSPTVATGGSGPFVDQLRAQGTPTIILRHLTHPISPYRDLLAYREIRRVLQESRPDLVAVHSSKAGVLGRLAAKSLGLPVLFTAHGWNFTPGIPRLQAAVYRRIERLTGPLANKIITVSEFDRQLAIDAGIASKDRIVVVHNGMRDVPTSLRADPARSPPALVMVARTSPQKDHPTLLRALGAMKEHAWSLELVGDGPLMGEIMSLADSLGISDRVHFLGQRLDVDQILARAQIGVLTTNWEGFPRSILEMMRAGLPVVATSVSGVGEAVRDGETGYLVPRDDVNVLRDRLERLLKDPTLRSHLGSGGRRRYEDHFTLDHLVAKTLAVYREVVGEKSNAKVGLGHQQEKPFVKSPSST
jgi:glycosyltransferase involved in cell wall biosynthesis